MKRRPRIHLPVGRRATAAVEFALVCIPFTIFLLAVMGTGLHFYMQQTLDYATQQSMRQVQLGQISGYSQADFVDKVFCPLFGQFVACPNLFVDLRPVTNYQQLANAQDAPDSAATTSFQFCTGTPGQLMYAHVVYFAPLIGGTLLGGVAGGTGAIISNTAFANENPTGIAAAQKNGC